MRLVNSLCNGIWKSMREWTRNEPRSYRIVAPGNVSETSFVPEGIQRPDYSSATLKKLQRNKEIDIKSKDEILRMERAGALAKHVLNLVKSSIVPGVTTDMIDRLVHHQAVTHGAYPSPLHYKGFPKSCCTSVNNVVCHGVPDDLRLIDGDIINVDVTLFYGGCHGDTSNTFPVGNVDADAERLIEATRECLQSGIDVCKPGVPFKAIAEVIEELAVSRGFTVCRCFVGHGIGSYFHGPPNILHFVSNRAEERLMKPGMTFTIEPVLMEGRSDVTRLSDGWTVVSKDDRRSAQAEHTVLITDEGCQILT